MISKGDEYPLHQTSRAVRDPGTDRNLYDRFFFNGYAVNGPDAGHTFFAVAFGLYPGRNICDAAFSVTVDGVQHNVRGSRLMGNERLDLTVDPVTVEIVEPLARLRVRVDAPDLGPGVRADLLFSARGPVFEEPHYRSASGYRTVFDITRMTQHGTWSGTITVGQRTLTMTDDQWHGCRDRSWGTRPVGEPDPPGAPDGGPRQFFWLWAPLNFADQCVIFDVNEFADGTRWHENAMAAPVGGTTNEVVSGTHTHDITWRKGTRHADAARLRLALADGRHVGITLERMLLFSMQGLGYNHPTWRHGMWVGDAEKTYDANVLADINEADFTHLHVQLLCRARRDDGAEGMGVLEMLIVGPHDPSGLRELLDGAR